MLGRRWSTNQMMAFQPASIASVVPRPEAVRRSRVTGGVLLFDQVEELTVDFAGGLVDVAGFRRHVDGMFEHPDVGAADPADEARDGGDRHARVGVSDQRVVGACELRDSGFPVAGEFMVEEVEQVQSGKEGFGGFCVECCGRPLPVMVWCDAAEADSDSFVFEVLEGFVDGCKQFRSPSGDGFAKVRIMYGAPHDVVDKVGDVPAVFECDSVDVISDVSAGGRLPGSASDCRPRARRLNAQHRGLHHPVYRRVRCSTGRNTGICLGLTA